MESFITLTILERLMVLVLVVSLSMIAGMLTRGVFENWFSRNYVLKSRFDTVKEEIEIQATRIEQYQGFIDSHEWEILASEGEFCEELEVEPDAIIQTNGVTFEEIVDLKDIMQGTSTSSDLDSVMVVAKMKDTFLFDQLQEQIKGAKQNLSLLIDRVDQKIQNKDGYKDDMEEYFYANTGFSIRDFLPARNG